jgi:Integrase core domain
MESFFHTLEVELIHRERFATREAARRELFAYLEGYYNHQRLHSALGYRTPEQAERRAAYPRVHQNGGRSDSCSALSVCIAALALFQIASESSDHQVVLGDPPSPAFRQLKAPLPQLLKKALRDARVHRRRRLIFVARLRSGRDRGNRGRLCGGAGVLGHV